MAGYLLTEHLYHSLTVHIGTAKAIFTESAIIHLIFRYVLSCTIKSVLTKCSFADCLIAEPTHC